MLNDRIEALAKVGEHLMSNTDKIKGAIARACYENKWFTEENCQTAISAIATQYLNPDALKAFTKPYQFNDTENSKTIGIIMAGNIPLVGIHDLIMVYLAGFKAGIKCSTKDWVLPKLFLELLIESDARVQSRIHIVDKLSSCDAIIATGSNNSHRYFDYYFGRQPHIFRKNRSGVAILDGNETKDQLIQLGHDIFDHFGLGCRNVAHVALPEAYSFEPIVSAFESFEKLLNHQKYRSNYDYNFALWSINRQPFYKIGPIFWVEDKALASRLASVHYSFYTNINALEDRLLKQQDDIQCLVGNISFDWKESIPFGKTQSPTLKDFADEQDTLQFLLNL